MRLLLAFAAAQSLGLFLNLSEAFSPSSTRSTSTTSTPTSVWTTSSSSLNAGNWENDDFLESLSRNNPGAKGGADDKPAEADPGGTRFKELMSAAQERGIKSDSGVAPADFDSSRSLKNPFADNPFAGIEGLDPTATPGVAPNVNLDELTVEQQAEMFRKMMKQQQGGGAAAPPPPESLYIPPLPKPAPPDRKTGRNRDADAIQNTADIYFAQLKRDSTVRGVARIRGDEEKANQVFADEKIEELKGLISKNPHLAGKREEEKRLIEAAAEELIAYQNAIDARKGNPKSSGISYRQKMEELKKKQRGVGGQTQTAGSSTVSSAFSVTPPTAQQPVQASQPPPHVPAQPQPTASTATSPSTEQHQQQPTASTPRVTASSSNEEIKKSVRTLMGLILKHRGGPGFGTGGLKGKEIGQYEQLMNDITALLKEEAKSYTGSTTDQSAAQAAATTAAPPSPSPSSKNVNAAPASPTAAAIPDSPSEFAQVDSMLACIDGAIMFYRNSPPELKEGVLLSVRSALLSAVNTCNKLMGQNEGIPNTPSASAGTQVETMLACVEGAVMMYRNSPPELQGGVMMTLRAALLSAVNTCNKIIAENDVANFQEYQKATAGTPAPPASSKKPTPFYAVVEEPNEETLAPSSTDKNSKLLEAIYKKLEAAAGNGKMGLREDLTAEEASELADSIAEMRSIMMDELANGIPAVGAASSLVGASATPSSSPAPPTGGSDSSSATMSKYQEMLAKAKADKASKS